MDLKQAEYILKIAEESNITHAAEKLFLTQPALNQQLLKLEKELGTQLFYRSRTNWRPTPAGEIYLESARELLNIQKETYNKIQDVIHAKKGTLSVGLTPTRGTSMFSEIYGEFHEICPDITVQPVEVNVQVQQLMIAHGDLDLGFMTLCEKQKTNDQYITICPEELVLAIPRKNPLSKLASDNYKPLNSLDIRLVANEPFVLLYKQSTIRPLTDEVFARAGITPKVLFETSNTNTIIKMINSSICCGIVPGYYVNEPNENIAYFSLEPKLMWEIAACYRKGGYLSEAGREFLRLAKRYWNRNC